MTLKSIFKYAFGLTILSASTVSAQTSENILYPEHFPLNEITLGESPLRNAMITNIDHLLKYDADRLLAPFIRQAGLHNSTNAKYKGWLTKHPSFTNWGTSDWSLEGHVGGHYLTALSLAIAATENDADMADKNAQMRERLNYCLEILKDCQDVYANDNTGMKGFIGGQPINQVWKGLYANNLTEFKNYGGWVPFYCQHKVLAGVRDAYVYAGSEVAKELFRGLSDWSVNVVSKLSESDMQTVLGWEHGGMNETLADAYKIFGDKKYLTAAKKYSHTWEINGMQTLDKNFLNGQHANTQVPKFIGFERIYQLDNTATKYRTAAKNFWDDVVQNRTVCIGGNSVDEHFLAPSNAGAYINNLNGPESCNTNNMLKLSESLFDETHNSKYADFYEAAMLNHILSTQDPTTGGYVYFTSLRPQSYRIYSQVNKGMWCCVGTGMENHGKYGHFIYTKGDNKLFVNLFTASTLSDSIYGIRQETQYPFEQGTTLTVTKAGSYSMAIRKPEWMAEGFSVKVNGAATECKLENGYAVIDKAWNEGDVVSVNLPMALRTEQCPNLPEYVAFKYGPVLLAARTSEAGEKLQNEYGGEGRMDHAPGSMSSSLSITTSPMLICNPDTVLNLISVKDSAKMEFTINAPADALSTTLWSKKESLTLEPFYGIHHSRYACYWYLQSKEDFAKSEIGQIEALAASLNNRTIDYVGTGEQQSEAGHLVKYSSGSTTGSFRGEFYRDAQAGGWIQYTLENKVGLTDSLNIMCRFITADKGRKGTISIDGKTIGEITIPETYPTADDNGFFNIEYKIPTELLVNSDGAPKESLKFRITAASNTLCPGLYYVRLVKAMSKDDVAQGTYQFVNTDWTTGDGNRVSASKFTYNDDNSITIKAGTGANNVALMMNLDGKKYTVAAHRIYLTVRGKNLKTTAGASYLWWLNGVNRGSQVAPTKVSKLANGEVVVAWDITQSGLSDNCHGALFNICQGQTIFGLTSTTGTSDIKEITFTDNIGEYIEVATSINSIPSFTPTTNGDKRTYDLSGRRVSNVNRGEIYIRDGKKIIKK